MTVDRQKRSLLRKLANASIDLAAYVQLRKAKGYMSVSESNYLRDSFFELSTQIRGLERHAYVVPDAREREALCRAEGALSAAGICLMSGHHDCPNYIAVNVETLDRCLKTLNVCIQNLSEQAPLVIES